MKILKILLTIFFLIILIIGVAVAIFVKTFDADKYKPQIVSRITKAIGRDVQIGKIGLNLSLAQGISLSIRDLNIADNPEFSKENFLTLKEAHLGVDVAAFL